MSSKLLPFRPDSGQALAKLLKLPDHLAVILENGAMGTRFEALPAGPLFPSAGPIGNDRTGRKHRVSIFLCYIRTNLADFRKAYLLPYSFFFTLRSTIPSSYLCYTDQRLT